MRDKVALSFVHILLISTFTGFVNAQSEIKGILKNGGKTASDTKFVSAQDNSLETNEATKPTTSTTTVSTTTTTSSSTTTPSAPTVIAGGKAIESDRHRLRKHVLNGYDKDTHPVLDHEDRVKVDLGMAIIHLDVDEVRSVMTVDAWMRLSWVDQYLTWDPEEFGGLTQVHFAAHELWRPDIFLYNSAGIHSGFDTKGNTHFVVNSDGSVLWVPPAHLEAYCKLNLRFWPLDTQDCKLKFGSWTSHGDQIGLGLYRNMTTVERLNFYTNNREWVFLTTTAEKNSIKYSCCEEEYPDVTFEFFLQRNSPAYKAVLILPCLIIMLMSVCSFLLPPTAGEKMTLNGLAFLASILYLLYFASTLPFHESHVPILVMFYSNTTALIGIAMLLNVTCVSLARERKYNGPPKFMLALFSGPFGKFLCLGNYYHQVSSTHQRLVLELDDMAESDQPEDGLPANGRTSLATNAFPSPDSSSAIMRDWILVAAGLERFFFILYTIIFGVVTSVYI